MKRFKVAMNAWALLSPHTGIASYTRNLALALQKYENLDLYYYYGLNWSTAIRETPIQGFDSTKKIIKKLISQPYEFARFIKQWRFDSGIKSFKPDVYHEPNYLSFNFDGPTVITVHDLSHIRYAGAHPKDRVHIMNKLLPAAIENASEIIVDSHFVGREVIEQFGVSPQKVHPIHLGVGEDFRPRTEAEVASQLQEYGLLPKTYILAVGTLEPRKNLLQAINAYMGLPEAVRKRGPLVIVGMRGWLSESLEGRIRQFEERGEVRWLGYVPAGMLPLLYSGARMLVYPSLYEGFGLPVIEAMASGIPVITSNRASLPEVAGDVGVMVDPEDTNGLREQMHRLIEDDAEFLRRGLLGVERALQFTWDTCAQNTLAVYRQAAGMRE